MKLFARPKCFSEIIAPVTTVNCIVGLRAFEYPRGNPRPILSLIYLAFIYITFCCGILRMNQRYYAGLKLMKLEYALLKLLMYIVLVSMILKMLLGWWHTKKFKVCLKKIFEIDETLQQLGLTVNYDRLYFVMIGIITVLITFVFVVWTMMFIHLNIITDVFTSIYLLLIYTYSFIVNSINIFEFFIFAKCSQMKFKLVNQLLRESLTDLSKKDKKLGIYEMKDYERIMDAEQQKQVLSTKMIFRRRQRVQTGINFSMKQNSVVFPTESHSPSHVTNHFQSVLQNQSRRHNSTITKYQKPKHLLQVIK
ncbi:PREDICTED: uncharacterized protein LOC105558770 [Vollenhovia emeryi]|uniref:uncharacterized protein LOC105558770 n=1 Tax=Vollenhovia emeryi TaxID=411798 RepID=UPI0005F45B2E|nr:PREDICTED: uncharacterized protein LOC105558770 [Vollenhovia emeryi]